MCFFCIDIHVHYPCINDELQLLVEHNFESANLRLDGLKKYFNSIALSSLLAWISVSTVSMTTVSLFDSDKL